jgi:hypothetical protein
MAPSGSTRWYGNEEVEPRGLSGSKEKRSFLEDGTSSPFVSLYTNNSSGVEKLVERSPNVRRIQGEEKWFGE